MKSSSKLGSLLKKSTLEKAEPIPRSKSETIPVQKVRLI